MNPKLSSTLRSTLTRAAALLALTAATCLSAQTTLNVGPDQTYATIQSAINAANAGDTVLVAPGTYYENIDFLGKAITVISASGAASTIIDGGSKGPAVSFVAGEVRSSILSGFTVQHGGVGNGIILQNGANYVTAGIIASGSAPSILNNTIQSNNCYGILAESASPLIQNNEIALTDPTVGRWCNYVAIGTGVLVDGALPSTPLYPTIIGNTIDHNDDTEDASSSGGGGIHVLVGYTVIENNVIRDNFSQQGGGGIAVSHFNPDYDGVLILQNLIYGNTSACGGGGLSFQQNTAFGIDSPVYYIINNDIIDNSLTNNCADAGNANAPTSDGSQVYLWQDSNRFVFVDNIIAGESDTQPAVYCEPLREYYPGFHLAIFDHNDIFNSQGASIGGVCVDQTGSYGNVAVDPLFVDRSTSNYQLAQNSPLIDAGNNSAASLPTQDFLGNPRQQDATGIGYPVIDIGAYEFAGRQDGNDTTVTVVPSAYQIALGDALTLTASMLSPNGIPAGSLNFFEDGQSIGSSPINSLGIATIQPPTIVPGVHAFIATYQAQGAFTPAISVKIFVVFGSTLTTLTLTSSNNPASLGQPVTFTITATSSSGTIPTPISLMDGTTLLSTLQPDASGNASYRASSLTAGSHLMTASYAGNSQLPATKATLTQVIAGATTTTLTSSLNPSTYGQPVTFTATVTSTSGTTTGSVIFAERGVPLATVALNASGVAQFTTSSLTANDDGTTLYHEIDAGYSPSGNFGASGSLIDQVVNGLPTTTTLIVTPTSGTTATTFTISATVASATSASTTVPTGEVVFYSSAQSGTTGNEIGYALLVNGVATLNTTGLLSGSDYVVGIYFGNTIYASSTSNYFTLTVAAPALTLTSSLNPAPALTPITFTAQLPAGSSGTVIFNINGQNISVTPNAAGTATTTINTLTAGSYLITADWFATGHALATQATLTQVVTPPVAIPDFSLTGTNITFKVLHSGSGDLELASLNNFAGSIALTCDPPYPANYTCTLQSPSINLAAGATSVVGFTLNYTETASARTETRIVLAALFPLTFFSLIGLGRGHRNALRTILSFALLAILTTATTACGPDHFIPITTGTYPITFSATGTSQGTTTPITHTVTIQATIAP